MRLSLILALGARVAGAAVVVAPGYAVHMIPTPGTANGGVVRRGDAILVGQGTFGAGGMSVVRLDGGIPTTIATGFNSLGGFDLDAAGTLYVVDNGGELGGATTGDTLYAIPNALTLTTAVTALGAEVVPAGTFGSAQDVLIGPGGIPIVTDALGVGTGRVATVTGTTVANVVTGLDFLGAVALTADNTLLVANVDGTFTGSVGKYTLAGAPLGPLIGGLSGAFGLAIDSDGLVLVSGGFTGDFSSSTVIAVDGAGAQTERAHGFGFSSDLYFDAARDELLALDVGVSEIAAICRDADGDGVCDADDPCLSTVVATKAALTVKKVAAPSGDEGITLKGQLQLPVAPLDPIANGARLVLATADAALGLDAALPPGAYDKPTRTGWKVNKAGNAWTYASRAGIQGIIKFVVKTVPKTPGLVKLAVTGRNANFPVEAADLPLHATFVLDAAGQCGDASFPGTGTCVFGSKLVCK